ncbi:hypothetical protein [Arthrobacter silvisoli]|uniref:hypothetical protein n=1 Tax=Arthrobacter silvisoli TaxID=2291022 RepID=UPI000E216346|nr:hypothetical protein [Arthrobacter silvisoli]
MERQEPPAAHGPVGPAIGAQDPENRQTSQPVQPGQYPTAAQPSAGWGAPPQQTQPSFGWGAPPSGQPTADWGAAPARNAGPNAPGSGIAGKWTLKKGLIAGGVAVFVAGATAAGIYAAGNATAADTGTQGPGGMAGQNDMSAQGGPGGFGMNGGGFAPDGLGLGAGGLGAAVHSEYVILRNGKYVNMGSQTGTVSQVSADSVTVRSEDGFTRSYSLGSDLVVSQGIGRGMNQGRSTLSISDVQSGAVVRITALQESGSYTAETIQLLTAISSGQDSGTGVPGSGSGPGASDPGTGSASN